MHGGRSAGEMNAAFQGGTALLILSRHILESIVINDNIVVTVVEIVGGKVKLGITAPPQIPVHRREIWEAIQRSKDDEVTP